MQPVIKPSMYGHFFDIKHAFIDIALDHGLASPDTADKTYRRASQKMKEKLKDI